MPLDVSNLVSQKLGPLWHKPLGGIAVAGLAAFSVLVLSVRAGATAVTPLAAVLTVVAFVFVLGIWWYTTRLPKNIKGKVGVAIAITCEDEREARQIEFDFVRTLRQLLQRDPAGANFNLVVLPPHVAEQIGDVAAAARFLAKTRCHFMIYGAAALRLVQGKETHVLSLEGAVRHAPVPGEVSAKLSGEFRQVLPKRVLFQRDTDVFAFDITSSLIDASARFVIGTAAYLSGDVVYAERLLLSVEPLVASISGPGPPGHMKTNVPARLKDVYRAWLGALADEYFMSRDRAHVVAADGICDKLLARDPDDYTALLFKAIAEFVLRRDVSAARALISRCRRIRDATWRYSLAFLLAYEGDLESAHDEYRRAFRSQLGNVNTPIEVEEFIQIVLQEEPGKEQLHFCLGLINYNVKNDYLAAWRDFERFLQSPVAARHPFAQRVATDLKLRCDQYRPHEAA